MDQNENKLNTEPILDDSGTGSAADVEAVMKKYDRESNTRIWTGKPALFIKILLVLLHFLHPEGLAHSA